MSSAFYFYFQSNFDTTAKYRTHKKENGVRRDYTQLGAARILNGKAFRSEGSFLVMKEAIW